MIQLMRTIIWIQFFFVITRNNNDIMYMISFYSYPILVTMDMIMADRTGQIDIANEKGTV